MAAQKNKIIGLVLVVDMNGDHRTIETLEQIGLKCLQVENRGKALELLKANPIDIIIGRIHNSGEDFSLFDQAQELAPEIPQIAIFDAGLEKYFPELLIRAYPRNLIADNNPIDYQELSTTVKKILSKDIFGLEKYGIPIRESLKLTRSNQKYDSIEAVSKFFKEKRVPTRLRENVELILNELLMNAIFDAPVDEKGQHKFHARNRSEVFDLIEDEQPVLEYGINQDILGVSVSDPFGTFQDKTFFSYVNRCFAEKSIIEEEGQGAGMGLFMVFKSLNQLIINVEYHQKTEVIALVDYHSTIRELKKRRHSFHYFHLGKLKRREQE